MKSALRRGPTLPVIVLLLLVAGICAGEQTRSTQHLDVAEACCAFTQCPGLPMALVVLVPGIVGAYLQTGVVPLVRSAVRDPLSPPPELIALRST